MDRLPHVDALSTIGIAAIGPDAQSLLVARRVTMVAILAATKGFDRMWKSVTL